MVEYNFKLHKKMKELSVTQSVLAKKVKISRTLVSYVLSGRWNLTQKEKTDISKVLKCKVEQIF